MSNWKYWTRILCFLGQKLEPGMSYQVDQPGSKCLCALLANSLIAVVSNCMHCKVCMHLNHGRCTSSTDYLYCLLAYDMLHSHSVCHFHTQSVWYAHAHIFHPLWRRASLTSVLCVPSTQLVATSHLPPAPSDSQPAPHPLKCAPVLTSLMTLLVLRGTRCLL